MNKTTKTAILFVAQGAFSGRSPVAPGTVGTVVAIVLYLAASHLSPAGYGTLCLLLSVIGVWTAEEAEKILGSKDSPSIVIDEIAGYFVGMALVPPAWSLITAGFLLFRFFDILKPWPLDGLQRVHGGLGVMLDDLGAGIYTNIILQLAVHYRIFPAG